MITRASDSSPARLNLLRNSPDFETLPITDTEIGKVDSPRSEPSSSIREPCSLTHQPVTNRFRNASCDCSSIVNSNFIFNTNYLTSASTFGNRSFQPTTLTGISNATCKVGSNFSNHFAVGFVCI